jgi:hypothetical protein
MNASANASAMGPTVVEPSIWSVCFSASDATAKAAYAANVAPATSPATTAILRASIGVAPFSVFRLPCPAPAA